MKHHFAGFWDRLPARLVTFWSDQSGQIRRFCYVGLSIASLCFLVALFVPFSSKTTKIGIGIERMAPPVRAILIFSLAIYLTSEGGKRAVTDWWRIIARTLAGRPVVVWVFAALFLAQLGFGVGKICSRPDEARAVIFDRLLPTRNMFLPIHQTDALVASFREKIDSLPMDARILYRGPGESAMLGYLAYPRRVFMLAEDRWDRVVELQTKGDSGKLRPDPLFPEYFGSMPATEDLEAFVRNRQISHILAFENESWSLTQVGP